MFCRECGNKLLPDSKFCDNCGTKAQAASRDTPNRDKILISNSTNVSKERVPEPASVPELAPTPERPPAANTEIQRNTKRSIVYWYFVPFRKYAVFSGRATRTEYWMFVLWNLIISISLLAIELFLIGTDDPYDEPFMDGTILLTLYWLVVMIPYIAVTTRRLHDIDRTGWVQLINFLPFGQVVLSYWLIRDSDSNENKYGPNPKLEMQ